MAYLDRCPCENSPCPRDMPQLGSPASRSREGFAGHQPHTPGRYRRLKKTYWLKIMYWFVFENVVVGGALEMCDRVVKRMRKTE